MSAPAYQCELYIYNTPWQITIISFTSTTSSYNYSTVANTRREKKKVNLPISNMKALARGELNFFFSGRGLWSWFWECEACDLTDHCLWKRGLMNWKIQVWGFKLWIEFFRFGGLSVKIWTNIKARLWSLKFPNFSSNGRLVNWLLLEMGSL